VLDSRLVEDLIAFARIPAPTFDEAERIEWLEARLRDAPGDRYRDDVGNLVWTWGAGRPRLLLAAHVDTVFARETPLEPVLSEYTLTGPGVGDNAAAVVAALHVVERLLQKERLATAALAFTVGEEGLGDLRGMHEVCRRLKPHAVIAVEGHGLDRVLVDAVGSVRAKVAVDGPGGHSWADRGQPSAIHALLRIGDDLIRAGTPEAPINIGRVAGGRSVNAIADHAEFLVERRALDEPRLAEFERALGAITASPPLQARVNVVGRRPAGRLPRDARLLQTVLAVRQALGLEARLDAGSTDANAALAKDIPALTLGVTNGSGMHTPGERIELAPLALGVRQLEAILLRLLVSDIRSRRANKAVIT
jgi:tripeptide aminopeptidase